MLFALTLVLTGSTRRHCRTVPIVRRMHPEVGGCEEVRSESRHLRPHLSIHPPATGQSSVRGRSSGHATVQPFTLLSIQPASTLT